MTDSVSYYRQSCFDWHRFFYCHAWRAQLTERKKNLLNYNKHKIWAENLTIVMQIGLTMAGCILFCFFIGLALDRCLETRGVFVAIFTILGVIGGGNTVYRQILEVTEGKQKDCDESKNGSD